LRPQKVAPAVLQGSTRERTRAAADEISTGRNKKQGSAYE
jgi:hypothetical protein